MVEQKTLNLLVPGSSPGRCTIFTVKNLLGFSPPSAIDSSLVTAFTVIDCLFLLSWAPYPEAPFDLGLLKELSLSEGEDWG
jgi:hypothetical protein